MIRKGSNAPHESMLTPLDSKLLKDEDVEQQHEVDDCQVSTKTTTNKNNTVDYGMRMSRILNMRSESATMGTFEPQPDDCQPVDYSKRSTMFKITNTNMKNEHNYSKFKVDLSGKECGTSGRVAPKKQQFAGPTLPKFIKHCSTTPSPSPQGFKPLAGERSGNSCDNGGVYSPQSPFQQKPQIQFINKKSAPQLMSSGTPINPSNVSHNFLYLFIKQQQQLLTQRQQLAGMFAASGVKISGGIHTNESASKAFDSVCMSSSLLNPTVATLTNILSNHNWPMLAASAAPAENGAAAASASVALPPVLPFNDNGGGQSIFVPNLSTGSSTCLSSITPDMLARQVFSTPAFQDFRRNWLAEKREKRTRFKSWTSQVVGSQQQRSHFNEIGSGNSTNNNLPHNNGHSNEMPSQSSESRMSEALKYQMEVLYAFFTQHQQPKGPVGRKRSQPTPDHEKDDKYWERRRKNNEAAKRSRDNRRAKEDELKIENEFLKQEFGRVVSELKHTRALTQSDRFNSQVQTTQQKGHQKQE